LAALFCTVEIFANRDVRYILKTNEHASICMKMWQSFCIWHYAYFHFALWLITYFLLCGNIVCWGLVALWQSNIEISMFIQCIQSRHVEIYHQTILYFNSAKWNYDIHIVFCKQHTRWNLEQARFDCKQSKL
jgi:hypothetical protein